MKNTIKLARVQKTIVERLPCDLSVKEIKTLKGLFGEQIVKSEDKKIIPASISDAVFCKNCAANDFMIPGIEFNKAGLCPMCQRKNKRST